MIWMDINQFLREEEGRFGFGDAMKDLLLTMFALCTVIGIPILFYATFIMQPRTRRYLKNNIYDIENTYNEIKIIKTQYNEFGIVWWKNRNRCRLLLKAEYDNVQRCDSNVFLIKQGGKYGIFRDSKLRVPIMYDYLEYVGNDRFLVSPSKKLYINSFGERIY